MGSRRELTGEGRISLPSKVAFDTETYPINESGKATTNRVPRLVCMSFYHPGMAEPALLDREDSILMFKRWLDAGVELIGHNVTFDILIMARALTEYYGRDFSAEVFELYEKRRVYDTIIHRKLKRIATKGTTKETGYSLKYLAKRYCGIDMSGKSGSDVWRLRYNELEGIPVDEYPDAAYSYAANDAEVTWKVWESLTNGKHYNNEDFQLLADLALNLMSAWGFIVDQDHAKWIYDHYAKKAQRLKRKLRKAGIIRDDGSASQAAIKEMFAKAWKRLGRSPKMTDSGKNVSTSKDTLQLLREAGYFGLADNKGDTMYNYSEYKTTQKFISTYLEPLMDAGDDPVCTRFTTIVDSGRTSSSGPNVQNFPAHLNADERRAKEEGFDGPFGPDIRGCAIPREDHVFLVADYSSIEMVALAQVMRNIAGHVTKMGEILNSGVDPHVYLLSEYSGDDYDTLIELLEGGDKDVARGRQITEAANYAFGGWAYPGAFAEYAKGYGVVVSDTEAKRAFDAYHSAYPGVDRHHFKDIKRSEVRPGRFEVELHGPNRATSGWMKRVCDRKTQAANTRFQSLVGAGTKYALWNLQKACYLDKDSPLYGDRLILFVHDENILEAHIGEGSAPLEDKKVEFNRIMIDSMNLFIPDIEVEAPVEVQRERWSK